MELDQILSGKGETVPEPEKTETDKPVVEEVSGTVSGATDFAETKDGEEQQTVPIAALHASRRKYTDTVADFQREIRERDANWERRIAELTQALTPKPQDAPVDWYQDPDASFRQRGRELIDPVVGQLSTLQSELAQLKAEREFGDKYQDFISLVTEATRNGDPEVRVLSAMMDASPQPYKVAKEWFERKTFDPAAKEAEIEARVLEKYGIRPDSKPQIPATMPTPLEAARNVGSRTGPAWGGPTPLGDIFKR